MDRAAFAIVRAAEIRRLKSYACLVFGALLLWQGCAFPAFRAPGDDTDNPSAASAGMDGTSGGIASAGASPLGGGSGATSVAGSSGVEQPSGGAGGREPAALAGRYRLVARHSSKCLDADGATTLDNEVTIAQHGCDAARPQTFVMTDAGAGFYALTVDGSSDCVDVESQLKANETPIVRAACDGGPSQSWLPVEQDDTSYFLINRLTGKCLDVPSQSTDDISLQQYTCNVGGNQRWVLASLDPQPLPLIVDDFFDPEPWSSTGMLTSTHDQAACGDNRAPAARGDCHAFALDQFPNGTTYAGASWLHPPGSWGSWPGVVVAPGAQRVRFMVRGAAGGEKIKFNAASEQKGTFKDGFAIDYTQVQLSTSWQEVSLDISAKTYADGVISGFAYFVVAADNTTPVAFYVDDITWE